MEMQSARANPDHSFARLDSYHTVPLRVAVGQRATQCLQNIFDTQALMLPLIHRGILEVEHHARSAGIQHLHYELRIIGRPSHLVALIFAPRGQLNAPLVACGCRRRKVTWFVSTQGLFKRRTPRQDERTVSLGKLAVQRDKESQESCGELSFACACGRVVCVKAFDALASNGHESSRVRGKPGALQILRLLEVPETAYFPLILQGLWWMPFHL